MLAAGVAGTLRFRGWLQEALLEVEICWNTSQKMYLRAAVRPGCHLGGDGALLPHRRGLPCMCFLQGWPGTWALLGGGGFTVAVTLETNIHLNRIQEVYSSK